MFLLASCKQNAEAIVIKSVIPDNIKAGVRFNVQPDGTSAITINATGATSATVPILSGVELPAVNVRGNGSVVTAVVPDKLYQKAGNFPLFLFDKKSGEKSNQIVIVVK
jgi:hypothetical protein